MPVRSLNSSVLKWPDADRVLAAATTWARETAEKQPEIVRIGVIGSYARGDWGPGSDLDLLVVVRDSDRAFIERARDFDVSDLPVPTDVLVYTGKEIASLPPSGRMASVIRNETRWLYEQEPKGDEYSSGH